MRTRLLRRNKRRKCSGITSEIFKKVAPTTTAKRKARKTKRRRELRALLVTVSRRGEGRRKVGTQTLGARAEEVTVSGDTRRAARERRRPGTEIPPGPPSPARRTTIPPGAGNQREDLLLRRKPAFLLPQLEDP